MIHCVVAIIELLLRSIIHFYLLGEKQYNELKKNLTELGKYVMVCQIPDID